MPSPRDDYALALDGLRLLARQDFSSWWANTGDLRKLREKFFEIQAVYGEQAAAAAVDYLVLSRSLDDDLAGLPFPDRADPAGYQQASKSFDWAVQTVNSQQSELDRVEAEKRLFGVLDRLVTLPARDTVVLNVERDKTAYARVPEPGACAFCLMLASRGAVYTKATVGAVHKYHDHCRCLGIEVKRDGSDLPRINRDLEQLWARSGSTTLDDFQLALNTRREFSSLGDQRNTQVYKLPTDEYRSSILRWQGMDRFYAEVQKAATGASSNGDTLSVASDLDAASKLTPLKNDVLMWRGVRNWHAAFGVSSTDELKKYNSIQARFTAITADRSVAEEEFTTFGKAGALLKVHAKKDTAGVWMPTNGSSETELMRQQEYLLPPGARIRVVRVEQGRIPIIHVEVSNGA